MFHFDQGLYCPITKQLFVDPVVSSDGYTYERDAIQQWIQTAGNKRAHPISPMNNITILDKNGLIPNKIVGALIESTIENYSLRNKKSLIKRYFRHSKMESTSKINPVKIYWEEISLIFQEYFQALDRFRQNPSQPVLNEIY